jgi:predicted permease
LRLLLHRRELDQALDDEIGYHLEAKTEENIARGMTPEAARRAARIELGGEEQVKEKVRSVRTGAWLETFLQDVHFGLRMLRRSPGFTAIAVLTLALGIGTNTAIFSVVDTVLLRPLPYKDPSRLVWATERFPFNHGAANVISPDFMGWQDHNQVFEQIAASGDASGANLTGAGQAVRVSISNVTTNFFSMLGTRPLIGRTFLSSEGKLSDSHVALLSESIWRDHFGASLHVLGKNVQLDGSAYTVVGVMPSTLRYPGADVWTPFALDDARFSPHSPRWAILTVIGRLKPGVAIPRAQADLQVITEQMDKEYPPQAARFRANARVELIPLHGLLAHNVRPLLLILMGAVGFLLVIACLNVANILLSRGMVRGREMGVRAALGAGRVRLIRQMLTEAFLLAIGGAVLGLLAGTWATKIVAQLVPPNFPSVIHLDVRIFGFAAFVAVFSVLAFGLVPALSASRTDVSEALKEGGLSAGSNRTTQRLRGLTAAGQIALSLILLIGAGLLLRSFLNLTDVKLGFDPHGVLMGTVQRPWSSSADASRTYASFFQETLAKVQNLPGVAAAAMVSQYPFGPPHNGTTLLNIQERGEFRPGQVVKITSISPDYFRVMKIPLLNGRLFAEQDEAGAPSVAIVNESLARILFDERNPLAKHISFSTSPKSWIEIVGVVSDTRDSAFEDEPGPELFVPYLQQPSYVMTFVVGATINPDSLAGALRKAVQEVDKGQPVFALETMDTVIANSLASQRFRTLLLGLFAMLALVLAAVGIFGVISYSVAQRTHEIGIRMALGAQRRNVLGMVVAQGFKLTLIGLVIGVAGALVLTRFLSSLLYRVKPTDPLTFIGVAVLLTAVALLACYIPARRATRVDPMVALRYE